MIVFNTLPHLLLEHHSLTRFALTHRRPPPQKAWGPGPNSFSQRSAMVSQQNGNAPPPRSGGNAKQTLPKDAGISDKQAHERLTFILAAAIVSYPYIQFPAPIDPLVCLGFEHRRYRKEWRQVRRVVVRFKSPKYALKNHPQNGQKIASRPKPPFSGSRSGLYWHESRVRYEHRRQGHCGPDYSRLRSCPVDQGHKWYIIAHKQHQGDTLTNL